MVAQTRLSVTLYVLLIKSECCSVCNATGCSAVSGVTSFPYDGTAVSKHAAMCVYNGYWCSWLHHMQAVHADMLSKKATLVLSLLEQRLALIYHTQKVSLLYEPKAVQMSCNTGPLYCHTAVISCQININISVTTVTIGQSQATFFCTFKWPCFVTNFFIIKPTRCTNFTNLFSYETLHVSDSSSVHHQEFIHCTLSNGICYTGL